MNPIMQMMNGSPIDGIMQAINGGMNPQAMAERIMQENPQAAETVREMQRNMGGRTPKQVAMEQCRSMGISEQQVMALAHRMGIR